jgi:PIN domain nuclease of toxin-antitoxin system
MQYLLDTHVILWWLGEEKRLSAKVRRVLSSASKEEPLLISDISLWEISMLSSLGRIQLALPIREWFGHLVAPPLVECQRITPAIAAEVANLPDSFQLDPANRIIVATARVLNIPLVTKNHRIKEAKLVKTFW